jgi:hypothetical protein
MLKLKTAFIGLAVLPGVAWSATEACVSLLVGAGYAAEMRIKSGDFKTDWSSSFPIGKTKCQSLSGVPIGGTYTVEVKAILGKTKNCSPSIVHSEGQGSITFQAWGTTLSPKCQMPTSDANFIQDSSHEANEDGVKAAKSLNKK